MAVEVGVASSAGRRIEKSAKTTKKGEAGNKEYGRERGRGRGTRKSPSVSREK